MDVSTEVGRLGPRPPDPEVLERNVQSIVDAVEMARARGRVRAKFRLNSFTTELHPRYPYKKESSRPGVMETDFSRSEPVEKRTLNFTPVTGGSDEDKLFWEASPSGSLQLGVVNQEAWKHFELGKSYYLDFTPAE